MTSTDRLDVLVVGGGQAGLAIGYHLAELGLRFLIVDAGSTVGETWKSRWDSLVLFTPAQFDALPGMPFPAGKDTYPTKDAVASYLRSYAKRFNLPVGLGEAVTALELEDGGYAATVGTDEVLARQVVVATGPFQTPFIPGVTAGADDSLFQIHSSEYRNPDSLPLGPVLVVGGANSGCQIARELAGSRKVELAVGRWGEKVGLSTVTLRSRLGRRLSTRDPVIGIGPRKVAKRYGVRLRPRVETLDGRTVRFEGGSTSEPAAIVWATGFRGDYSWIRVPEAVDGHGAPLHRRGVSAVPGLYFLGLSWQWTRGSALLGWVQDDAAYLARRIAAFSNDTVEGAIA